MQVAMIPSDLLQKTLADLATEEASTVITEPLQISRGFALQVFMFTDAKYLSISPPPFFPPYQSLGSAMTPCLCDCRSTNTSLDLWLNPIDTCILGVSFSNYAIAPSSLILVTNLHCHACTQARPHCHRRTC